MTSLTTAIKGDLSSENFGITVVDFSPLGTSTLATVQKQLRQNKNGYIAGLLMQVTKNFDQDNNFLKTIETIKGSLHFQIVISWGLFKQVYIEG